MPAVPWLRGVRAALLGRLCSVVLPHTLLFCPVSRSGIRPHFGGEMTNIGNEVTHITFLLCQKEAKSILRCVRKSYTTYFTAPAGSFSRHLLSENTFQVVFRSIRRPKPELRLKYLQHRGRNERGHGRTEYDVLYPKIEQRKKYADRLLLVPRQD